MSVYRVGFAFSQGGRAKLLEYSSFTGMGQTALIESLLYGLTKEQAKEIAERGAALRQQEMDAAKEVRKQARKAISNLSPEELQAIIAKAEHK